MLLGDSIEQTAGYRSEKRSPSVSPIDECKRIIHENLRRAYMQPVPNQSNVEHIPEVDEPNEPIANSMTPEFDQQWPSSTMPDIKAIESTTADATVVSTTQKVNTFKN